MRATAMGVRQALITGLGCLALTGCAPPDFASDDPTRAPYDYDVFIPDEGVAARPRDRPPLPEGAEDCNANGIEDAFDWAGFMPRGPYPVGRGPREVVAAEMTGGGRLELVALNYDDGAVSVLTQARDRRFARLAEDHAVGAGPTCLTAADLDGDAAPDLLVGHQTSAERHVTVLTNRGAGAAFDRTDHPISTDPYLDREPRCVAVSDQTAAGGDVLATSGEAGLDSTNRMISLFPGADFRAPVRLRTSWLRNPGLLVTADFDGDGDEDVCALSTGQANAVCVPNRPERAFDWRTSFSAGVGMTAAAATAADVDGDGRPDLVVVGENGLIIHPGTGDFAGRCVAYTGDDYCERMESDAFAAPLGPFDLGSPARAVAAADFDGDGDVDLAIALPDRDRVAIIANGPGGIVASGGDLRRRDLPVRDGPRGLLAEDTDGDGRIEIVVANAGSDDLWVLHRRASPEPMLLDCAPGFEARPPF